jgi:uncharacterized membrane protein
VFEAKRAAIGERRRTASEPEQLALFPSKDRLVVVQPAWIVLALMVTVWSVVFGVLVWQRHERFGSFGFDLGIFDQAAWLLSRPGRQFITVRGLPVFGHHANFGLYLLAPFYWLGAGPHFLNVFQVVVASAGAIPIFLLARHRLGNEWIALPLALAYLFHPSLQYLMWEHFHPETVAITPLLFAYWFSVKERWRLFAVCAVLAVVWKEDVALALVVLGLIIALRGRVRIGLLTAGLSLAWFLFVIRVLLPHFSGSGIFYVSFFSDLGDSPVEIVHTSLSHPSRLVQRVTAPSAMSYYARLVVPFGFTSVLSPVIAAIGAPQLLVNVVSSADFTRSFTYHYAALPLAGLAVAMVEGIAASSIKPAIRRFLVGVVAASALATTTVWGPSPLGAEYRKGWWAVESPRNDLKSAALAMIPDGAAVSASHSFVPHLTHRERIYQFPNPFRAWSWGIADRNPPAPTAAEWLVIDRRDLLDDWRRLFDGVLAGGEFRVVSDRDEVVVARRR